ncbi:MAG: DUF5606 domain-containing protein [Saprospiraceae bacterium]|nr:DUF5606 domain-containing protein [Saprospiraceae bacterium]
MSKLKDLMAVTGLPGLYRMVGNRPNGLIAEDLDTGKRRFLPMRKHQFSPLETIAIFTITDSIPLMEVLERMTQKENENPPVSAKSTNTELRAYFSTIVPDHDEYRVFPRDIAKIIKWHAFLQERNLLHFTDEEE